MYTGEFKNGARYKTVHGEGLITYIGALNDFHYFLDVDSDLLGRSDERLRNLVKEEIKTPKTITRYMNIGRNNQDTEDEIKGDYASRGEADFKNYSGEKRIACVKVTITYTDGQFDE